MLDQEIKDQLRGVFADIKNKIELVYTQCSHENQAELVEMLTGIAETSPNISTRLDSGATSSAPSFKISIDGKLSRISFSGIPGGHEFTSLIVAILNAAGLGKMPDEKVRQRILALKGPVSLKTYISLSCENCPEVVQALNQMALIHPDFHHEMVDGGYFENEIKSLGIQGVPSVVQNNKMLNSGKTSFLDLLKKLEDTFGVDSSVKKAADQNLGEYDVIVIGGGPAGASAAIYSVRKGLKTAIIAERFGGQVTDTKGIENLIGVTYTEGPQLAAQLSQHMASYPIKTLEHQRVTKVEKGSPHKIILDGGDFIFAHSIIVTTGAKWRELGVPGEKEYLGRGVAFCPHCDGPFYKGKKIAVIGGGNSGVEAAIDLAGIVKEVVLIEYGSSLKADQVLVDKLKSMPNTSIVVNAKTTEVKGDGQTVNALVYIDRVENTEKTIALDGIFVQIGLLPNSGFIKDVVETSKFGEIIVDNKGRTNIPKIYAAGDVTTTPFKQIIIAMGEGAKAALAAFEDRMYAEKT